MNIRWYKNGKIEPYKNVVKSTDEKNYLLILWQHRDFFIAEKIIDNHNIVLYSDYLYKNRNDLTKYFIILGNQETQNCIEKDIAVQVYDQQHKQFFRKCISTLDIILNN